MGKRSQHYGTILLNSTTAKQPEQTEKPGLVPFGFLSYLPLAIKKNNSHPKLKVKTIRVLACLQHGEEKIETWLDITETLSSMKSDENMV